MPHILLITIFYPFLFTSDRYQHRKKNDPEKLLTFSDGRVQGKHCERRTIIPS